MLYWDLYFLNTLKWLGLIGNGGVLACSLCASKMLMICAYNRTYFNLTCFNLNAYVVHFFSSSLAC